MVFLVCVRYFETILQYLNVDFGIDRVSDVLLILGSYLGAETVILSYGNINFFTLIFTIDFWHVKDSL